MERAAENLPQGIDVRAVARRFGRRWALRDVTLHVPAGGRVMIGGHNGSGKTTLLRILAGALRPDAGEGSVGGADLEDRHALRQATALLSHASATWDTLTAADNLEVVARATGRYEGRAQIETLLTEVGLGHRAGDTVATFSAGMRRRLALARLVLQSPRVVLLDEPWGQLDPGGFALLDRVMSRLTSVGATIVFTTHMLDHGASRADEAILLSRGRVVWRGRAGEAQAKGQELGWD